MKLTTLSTLAPDINTTDAGSATQHEPAGTEFWRADRVARYFDVSRRRVYQLVEEKKLEGVWLGPRTLRVPRSSVERYHAELLATGIAPAH